MSWDIYILNFPASENKIADIPDDLNPVPMVERHDLMKRIYDFLPEADFSDPTCGNFERRGCSIEFDMGSESVCNSIMLHVCGGGDAPTIIAALWERLELRAIDCQTGEFFEVHQAKISFESWQRYRDQVPG